MDVSAVRSALANQITNKTGLRTLPEARDMISPPVAVILPGSPYVHYGETLDNCLTINLKVVILVSDAPPDEKVQRALDAYLGIGTGTSASSIPAAVQADPTLSGAVQYAEVQSISQYGRFQWAAVEYFGATMLVTAGAV